MAWKNGLISAEKEILVNDEIHTEITQEAMAINRIDLDVHNNIAVDYDTAREEFLEFVRSNFVSVGRLVIGGHNVAFDIRFLKELVGERQWDDLFSYRSIDTGSILRFLWHSGLVRNDLGSLSNALRYFGFTDSQLEHAHTALIDAKNTALLYNRMLRKVVTR